MIGFIILVCILGDEMRPKGRTLKLYIPVLWIGMKIQSGERVKIFRYEIPNTENVWEDK